MSVERKIIRNAMKKEMGSNKINHAWKKFQQDKYGTDIHWMLTKGNKSFVFMRQTLIKSLNKNMKTPLIKKICLATGIRIF